MAPLTEEDVAELERRDRELDDEPDFGLTWPQIRARIEADGAGWKHRR